MPRVILLFGALALLAQIAWHAQQPHAQAEAVDLPNPPSATLWRAASFGDPITLSKVLMLWLQAFDNQPGISIPFRRLDYARVEAWLDAKLRDLRVLLKKLDVDYDPTDATRAMNVIRNGRDEMKLVTGLLYVNTEAHRFDTETNMIDEPLASLGLDRVRPGKGVLDSIMRTYQEGSAPVGAGGG